MAVDHGARRLELGDLVAHAELLGGDVGLLGNVEQVGPVDDRRERLGHDPVLEPQEEVVVPAELAIDVDALAALGRSVLRAVDHAPLNAVPQGRQAGEDDREVAPALTGGALE